MPDTKFQVNPLWIAGKACLLMHIQERVSLREPKCWIV